MEEELRRMTAELVQAGKLTAIGQLAAGLCHELNQPLTAMRSYTENAKLLLARGKHADVRTNLGLIGELLERAATITGHLKLLAKDAPERREDVSLEQVVRTVVSFLRARAEMEHVELDVDVQADAVVRGDMIRLEQVCMNIIINALDALRGRDDGRISVTLARSGTQAALTFRDNGAGIEKGLLGKLFEPFFTVKEDGLGLGLPITMTIVEEHGGTMKAANARDGGAVFTVKIPLKGEEGERE
jgi:two-component system C4-dicarboxylate transport sensor histidine kinase DctB